MDVKRFVLGDPHGRIEALKEVLKASKFSYSKDKLILLGDENDGGKNTKEVIDELLKIKNLIYVYGNHSIWFLNFINENWRGEIWLQQGGANTLRSYGARIKEADYMTDESIIDLSNMNIPQTHKDFLRSGKYYHIENNMLFVHGGIIPDIPIEKQKKDVLLWDRDLINYARKNVIKGYDKVFIGHTTTQIFGNDPNIKDCLTPIQLHNLIMVDIGAGGDGKLCLYNIDTDKYYLSKKQKFAK